MTLVFTTCYRAIIVLLIFENLFCLPGKNVFMSYLEVLYLKRYLMKLFYLRDFQACKYQLKYCSPISVYSSYVSERM